MRAGFSDYTLVVGCDERTQEQLRGTWPTWRRYRPELLNQPMVVICDARLSPDPDWWRKRLHWLDHPAWRPFLWDWPAPDDGITREVSQRERMLTAFIRVARVISTAWYLKIDTDVVATAGGPVILPEWVAKTDEGVPALVASAWGYTKPGDFVDDLQDWADKLPQLRCFKRLDLPSGRGIKRFRHPRICSWICLINTGFGLLANQLSPHPNPLPAPSQDTYHWYVAARRGDRIQRVSFKRLGWHTYSKNAAREDVIRGLMEGDG
jgi:hypothetical protein